MQELSSIAADSVDDVEEVDEGTGAVTHIVEECADAFVVKLDLIIDFATDLVLDPTVVLIGTDACLLPKEMLDPAEEVGV